MVSDELSELAMVTAADRRAAKADRFREIYRSFDRLESNPDPSPDLPCWIGVVGDHTFTCHADRRDTATDATVRFGLALFLAGHNPAFSDAERAIYLARAEQLAVLHMAREYAAPSPCWRSPVTGRSLCYLVAAGADAAEHDADPDMYIGYFQDVARFLLAAYAHGHDPAFLARAEDVIDEYLVASGFDGSTLSFGCKSFAWVPVPSPSGPTAATTCLLDWEYDDAPRALWMGDVLRAYRLATGSATPSQPIQALAKWTDLLVESTAQSTICTCVKYNTDGSVNGDVCFDGHYENGLGLGLLTARAPVAIRGKLERAMSHYQWNQARWDTDQDPPSTPCFSIYRGVRAIKALASAIGRDAQLYGWLFSDRFESGNAAAWSGRVP
ncbi:MAG TPA: hypothetical protein VFS60_17070 [Thermoanaerobaculia bacterium]|nr:hypothetical protein [Thermoanaerobaculia bacterium]